MNTPTTIAVALAAIALAAVLGGYIIDRLNQRPATRTLRIQVIQGDITRQNVDAIVNAAKRTLLGGSGVDGAIHHAGGTDILRACHHLRATTHPDGLPAGQAVATTAGNLPAEWVIHTVGPVYDPTVPGQAATLRSCYTESLRVAEKLGAETVAFPLISSGVYGWPVADAITQAITALNAADTTVKTARLVLFDEDTYNTAQSLRLIDDTMKGLK